MRTRNKVLTGAAAALAMAIGAVVMLTGTDLQSQVNAANCGDTITLDAGTTITVNLTLPVKPCTDNSYITIQSSRANELPVDKRVSPAQSALFAKLQSNTNAEPVVKTAPGAHHYKFIGIEFSTSAADVIIYDIVRFGNGRQNQTALAQVPNNLVIDRSYIHGWPTQDNQRGVSMNCAECWVTNSYISDIHGVGIEAQAIGAWNGPGPIHIINNYLEGAGENIMIGGADSASAELIPSNGEIRRNYLFKPLSWNPKDPSFVPIMRNGEVKHWTVKNILELKSAKNWVIDGNVLENIWVDAQDGSAVLFTVRNQECTAPWSTIENITYGNNTLRNVAGAALNLLGKDNEAEPEFGKCPASAPTVIDNGVPVRSVRGKRVTVGNNLFYGIRGAFLQMNGFLNVSIGTNTHLQNGNLTTIYGEPSPGFRYTKNLTTDHEYGLWTEAGIGVPGLAKLVPDAIIEGNWIAAPYDKGVYPPNNNYPNSIPLPPDFRSPIVGVGCDIDVLKAAQDSVVIPPFPTPTPSVTPSVSPSPTATQPLPSPTPTSTVLPSPSPTVSPSPRPSPSPSPSPQLPNCTANQIIGNPAKCLCRTGVRCTGNNARCL